MIQCFIILCKEGGGLHGFTWLRSFLARVHRDLRTQRAPHRKKKEERRTFGPNSASTLSIRRQGAVGRAGPYNANLLLNVR